jgi:hypothetical protein
MRPGRTRAHDEVVLVLLPADRRLERRRRHLADGLERAVARAYGPGPGLSAEVPVAREAVRACADRLLVLVRVLRSPRELPEPGLRALRALVTDGAGPLFVPGDDLPAALGRVERALGLS